MNRSPSRVPVPSAAPAVSVPAAASPVSVSSAVSPGTASPVPRWARVAAGLVPFTVLPSSLWRIVLGLGVPVGFTGQLATFFHAPGWITLYVLALSAFAEAVALTALGLVRSWGETVPRWVPRLGGRTVPVMAAVIPATLGALALFAICAVSVLNWYDPQNNGDPDAPHGIAGLIMTGCYATILAWPFLLAAVTAAYYVRRRRDGAPLWTFN